MGIRFTTNTWRAPLLLIDSWLPLAPGPRHTPTSGLPRAVQRFARAGWLARNADAHPMSCAAPARVQPSGGTISRPDAGQVRVLQAGGTSKGVRQGTRLIISGRINDVCAELDRLAAMEQRHG